MAPSKAEGITAFLRRVAGGDLVLRSHAETRFGNRPRTYCYQSGEPLPPFVSDRQVERMIADGRLLPIRGESMFSGPPQRYRARTVADGPLPR